ncbi:MAG: AEC family transporter [Alphaproteobacteria bacterium]
MQMILVLLPILAPVFITAAVGYAFTRWGPGFGTDLIAKLVANIFAPALIFSTFLSSKAEVGRILLAGGAVFACILIAGAIAYALLRALKAPIRTYLPASMFPNIGNVGGPVCYFAFGDEGLAYAVAAMAAATIGMWTLGAWISSGSLSPRRVATTPPLIAAALGVIGMFVHWHLPKWMSNSLELLGQPTFPLMLLALGASLATMKVHKLSLSIGLGAYRVIAGTLIGLAISEVLGLKGALRGVVILQSGMPSAVFNYLFAQINNRRPEEVASVIVASTLISAAALPLLVTLVLALP